ncbi:MAG: glycosyltransferase [Candidatus Aureabacteria bacterium]|nr:glycosyltransferase [Candidatus Auribacterota bacterium]
MKKILLVIPSIEGGGAERVMLHLIDYLNAKGYPIRLVLFNDVVHYPESLPVNIEIRNLGKKSRFSFLKLIRGVAREIREYEPQVVLSSLYYANIVSTLASIFTKKKFKLLLWEHNNPKSYLTAEKYSFIKIQLMKFTYKKADVVITVSKVIKKIMEDNFNIPFCRAKAIYNPIPIEIIRERSYEKVEHGFLNDPQNTVLIAVGRFNAQKRYDRLLGAFKLAHAVNNSMRLLILGQGSLEKDLKQLSVNLGLIDLVDFIGFKNNPYAWMKQADIFVLTSDYEGFPMVLLEAMACGIPIVSVDCPTGPDELILSGENGLLVKMTAEAIASGICALAGDKDMRERFVSNGLSTIEHFTYDKIFPEFEKLFSGTEGSEEK